MSQSASHIGHSYLNLPRLCYQPSAPSPVSNPQWVAFNQTLASELQLPESYWLTDAGLGLFSGNQLPDWCESVAQAYAGHQFGHFNPQLGDGRAHLLAELHDQQGQVYDLQLKGSGRTPYSRSGDGRSPLGPVLREYLVSEFMHRMQVPTTRALAAVATGESVRRESPEPGAILTRVASSHLRVGSLQYAMVRGDFDTLAALADFAIARHYPELDSYSDEDSSQCIAKGDTGNRYLALLEAVAERQARLISQWMGLGFIHGVMNTDNTSISGETIDYGPCAFMEAYQADKKFSFIDQQGRYAYNQQPSILHWNMARLAEALLPLIDNDKRQAVTLATAAIERLPQLIEGHWLSELGRKLGLHQAGREDKPLIEQFLAVLEQGAIDFTLGFRMLAGEVSNHSHPHSIYQTNAQAFLEWRQAWQQRLQLEPVTLSQLSAQLNSVNPLYIPRNHLIQAVIDSAYSDGDLRPFIALQQALSDPFTQRDGLEAFATPATADAQVTTTFCGT